MEASNKMQLVILSIDCLINVQQCAAQAEQRYKLKYEEVGVLPIWIIKSKVFEHWPFIRETQGERDEGPMLETFDFTYRIGGTPVHCLHCTVFKRLDVRCELGHFSSSFLPLQLFLLVVFECIYGVYISRMIVVAIITRNSIVTFIVYHQKYILYKLTIHVGFHVTTCRSESCLSITNRTHPVSLKQ